MAVSNSTVFTASHTGFVYAIDAETGRIKWRFQTTKDLASSPAVADGNVYFVGADGALNVVDSQTGQTEWVFRPVP